MTRIITSRYGCCINCNVKNISKRGTSLYSEKNLLKALLNTYLTNGKLSSKNIPNYFPTSKESEYIDLLFTTSEDQKIADTYNKQLVRDGMEFYQLYLFTHGISSSGDYLMDDKTFKKLAKYFPIQGLITNGLVYESKVLTYVNYLSTLEIAKRSNYEIFCYVELISRNPAELAFKVEISDKIGQFNKILYEASFFAPSELTIQENYRSLVAKHPLKHNRALFAKHEQALKVFNSIRNFVNNHNLVRQKLSNPANPHHYIPVKSDTSYLFTPKAYKLTEFNGFWIKDYSEKDRELYNSLLQLSRSADASNNSQQKDLLLANINVKEVFLDQQQSIELNSCFDNQTPQNLAENQDRIPIATTSNNSIQLILEQLPDKNSSYDLRQAAPSLKQGTEWKYHWFKRLWRSLFSFFCFFGLSR